MTSHPEIFAIALAKQTMVDHSIILSISILILMAISSPVSAGTPADRDCTFSNSVAGKIGLSKNGQQILGSNPNLYDSASSGHIDFVCGSATTIGITDPIQISGATITDRNLAVVDTGAGLVFSPNGNGSKSIVLNASLDRVRMKIDMENSSSTRILSGNYSYKIMLTVTPN